MKQLDPTSTVIIGTTAQIYIDPNNKVIIDELDSVEDPKAKKVIINGGVYYTTNPSVYWDYITNKWELVTKYTFPLVIFKKEGAEEIVLGKTSYDVSKHLLLKKGDRVVISPKANVEYTNKAGYYSIFNTNRNPVTEYVILVENENPLGFLEYTKDKDCRKLEPARLGVSVYKVPSKAPRIAITEELFDNETFLNYLKDCSTCQEDVRMSFIYDMPEDSKDIIALYMLLHMIEPEYNLFFPARYSILPHLKQLPLPNLRLRQTDIDNAVKRIDLYFTSKSRTPLYNHFYMKDGFLIFRSVPSMVLNKDLFKLLVRIHKAIIEFAKLNSEFILNGFYYNLMYIIENSDIEDNLKNAFYSIITTREDELPVHKARYSKTGHLYWDQARDVFFTTNYEVKTESGSSISEPVGTECMPTLRTALPDDYTPAPIIYDDDWEENDLWGDEEE